MKFMENNIVYDSFQFRYVYLILTFLFILDIFLGKLDFLTLANLFKIIWAIISLVLFFYSWKKEIVLNNWIESLQSVQWNTLKNIFWFSLPLKRKWKEITLFWKSFKNKFKK